MIGVTTDCITNWENNRSAPQIQFMPAIIEFLGFVPIEINISTFGRQILLYRNIHKLSQKKLGQLIGVDGSTISSWEKEERIPYIISREKLNNLIVLNETNLF